MKQSKIYTLVIHCSDSDIKAHDDISIIRAWHTRRGFVGPDGIADSLDDVGYHYFIKRDGTIQKGREDQDVGAHTKGHNKGSLGICFSGRTFADFNSKQFEAGRELLAMLMQKHKLEWSDVKLHRDLDKNKTCPNFSLNDLRLAQ